MAYKMRYRDWTKRFWANVNKNGPVPLHRSDLGQCWPWIGSTSGGYGQLRISRLATRLGIIRAHRLAYLLEYGELPPSEFTIRHLCDNRPCVRGSHIEKGTDAANAGDRVFLKTAKNSNITREQWDADSLYNADSRVTVWIRKKNDTGKWRYQRLQSRLTENIGPFHLRYTNAEGKRV